MTLRAISKLSGDFNGDGTVDTADYVLWRKTDGGQVSFHMWQSNFGRTAGSGAALPSAEPLSAAVPEPSLVALLAASAAGFGLLKTRRPRRLWDN